MNITIKIKKKALLILIRVKIICIRKWAENEKYSQHLQEYQSLVRMQIEVTYAVLLPLHNKVVKNKLTTF